MLALLGGVLLAESLEPWNHDHGPDCHRKHDEQLVQLPKQGQLGTKRAGMTWLRLLGNNEGQVFTLDIYYS